MPEEFEVLLHDGVFEQDIRKLLDAHKLDPTRPEPLYWLARIWRSRNNAIASSVYSDHGLRLPRPSGEYDIWIYEHGLLQEFESAKEKK